MAEVELSVLQRRCFDRRLADRATLGREVAAWTRDRNAAEATIDRRFTTTDARIERKRLYPAIHD
jgi:hypothetical protein